MFFQHSQVSEVDWKNQVTQNNTNFHCQGSISILGSRRLKYQHSLQSSRDFHFVCSSSISWQFGAFVMNSKSLQGWDTPVKNFNRFYKLPTALLLSAFLGIMLYFFTRLIIGSMPVSYIEIANVLLVGAFFGLQATAGEKRV